VLGLHRFQGQGHEGPDLRGGMMSATSPERTGHVADTSPAAQIRALVPLALEAMQTEHEADRTTSIMMAGLSCRCELTGDMLQRMIVLMDGLQVFPIGCGKTSTCRAA